MCHNAPCALESFRGKKKKEKQVITLISWNSSYLKMLSNSVITSCDAKCKFRVIILWKHCCAVSETMYLFRLLEEQQREVSWGWKSKTSGKRLNLNTKKKNRDWNFDFFLPTELNASLENVQLSGSVSYCSKLPSTT